MKKRVIIIGPLLKTGGVSKYVKDILNAEINYDIIHFNSGRPPKKKTCSDGIVGYNEMFSAGILRFLTGIFITLLHVVYFPFILLYKRPQIVHICGISFSVFWENAYYVFISKLFRKKIFLHYLGAFDLYYNFRNSFEKYMIRNVLKKVDRIALLSEKVKKILLKFIPENRMYVLPSSIKISDFFNQKGKLEIINDNRFHILFVGGGDPFRKGLSDVIKSIPLVVKELNNVSFILTGGENVYKVEQECDKRGIREYVNFWGWIKEEEIIKLYNSVDMLLLPSYNEGLPYVIIEALAAGLPIISTPVGGIPEVIEDGKNGYLISPGDYISLAKKILLLISNESVRNEMKFNNLRKAKEKYSLDIIICKIENIYNDLLQ